MRVMTSQARRVPVKSTEKTGDGASRKNMSIYVWELTDCCSLRLLAALILRWGWSRDAEICLNERVRKCGWKRASEVTEVTTFCCPAMSSVQASQAAADGHSFCFWQKQQQHHAAWLHARCAVYVASHFRHTSADTPPPDKHIPGNALVAAPRQFCWHCF